MKKRMRRALRVPQFAYVTYPFSFSLGFVFVLRDYVARQPLHLQAQQRDQPWFGLSNPAREV